MRKIPVASPVFAGNEKKYVEDCMERAWISFGDYNRKFEKAFAEFCGTRFAVSCSNGTAALHLALLALGVGPGDEVIVPTLTYVSTANAVSYCGATPVFVDSEPLTGNMDAEKICAKITSKTTAILPVHLYGHPCDMDAIKSIADAHGLFVLEDAAEAHGAEYKGQKVGSMGDISAFSFFANKIIAGGEGGMVVTDNEGLATKARQLMGVGQSFHKRYWFPVIGYNYRMSNIHAAIGLAQLEQVETILEKREQLAEWYNLFLGNIPQLTLPIEKDYAKSVNWMYNVILADSLPERDTVMELMAEEGIETRPFFYPLHTMPPYKSKEGFPVAEDLARRGISLPTHVGLEKKDVDRICSALIRTFY